MKTETTDNGTLENWTPREAAEAFARDEIVIIDVRTPQEYGVERIDGALLAPMQAFEARHMPDQDSKRIVFHCGSGVRSRKVAEACLAGGMERVAHIDGGFTAWKEAGLDYTGTDMATGAPKRMRKES